MAVRWSRSGVAAGIVVACTITVPVIGARQENPVGATALVAGLCNAVSVHGPSIPGSSLMLRDWPMMYFALLKVIPIRFALMIAAALGALETPVTQCMYALSPCLSELSTYGINARM